MKIHSIELHNFLCYYGNKKNKINFTDGLNLILGANGYGKSKLYDAFQWVFKNGISDEANTGRLKNTEQIKKGLISDRALAEAKIGDKVVCEVNVEVSDLRDSYQLKRKYYVVKKSNEEWLEAANSTLEVYRKDVIHFKPVDEARAIEICQKLIPDDVMPYVWFQGERGVNSIIDTSSSGSLKRVIQRLSDIEKWEDYILISEKAAATAKNQFNLAFKASNTNKQEYDDLTKKQKEEQSKLEKIIEQLQNAKNNLAAANEKSSNVLGKLSSAKKIEDLNRKKNDCVKELEGCIKNIESFHLDFTKNLFKEYWLLMDTENWVTKFEEKYTRYVDFIGVRKTTTAMAEGIQNRLPRGIPERMHVQDMLNKELCLVCNRPAKKGSPEYKAIEELLPELNPIKISKPDIESDLRRIWNAGFSLSDKFKNADSEIIAAIKENDDSIELQKKLKEQIANLESDINNEILNSGVEQATDIIAMANLSNQDIQTYSNSVGKLSRDKDACENSLKFFENKLKKLSVGEIDPVIVKKMDLLEDLADLAKRIKDKQYKELVDLLEKTSNEHYERINKPTGAFYGKIKFVETTEGGFIPEILNDNGERVNNLNTSQTSSLKLAIIMAIVTANHSRGYADKYPLISDAPISDFDSVKAKAFLKETANTFAQSIIIVKDYLEEDGLRENRYRPEIERLRDLSNSIGKDLNIIQLDLPEGIVAANREQLTIEIKPVHLK